MDLSTKLNIGLCALGYLFIMFRTGDWVMRTVFKAWDKRRKESRRKRAVNELYDAFELDQLKDGSTMRVATKGDLNIFMYRKGEVDGETDIRHQR